MARKQTRTATAVPQSKTPRVPYATVDRLNFWQYKVLVVDPALSNASWQNTIYDGVHIGRDRANSVAKRHLNRYLRKQAYKNEPVTTYRAKGGAY